MIISYNGKNYFGFQKQKNARTIQGELEDKLKIIFKKDIAVVGSGRTDAKVSAYYQHVHFETDEKFDEKKLLRSMNGLLEKDIRVLDIFETTLHARDSKKKKTYLYKMYLSDIDLPLEADRLQLDPKINIKEMKKFISLLKGSHDFVGFRSSGSVTDTTVRTIYSTKLIKKGNHLDFYITGNGFLYKMVRNIVGTMIKIGEGKLNLTTIKPTIFTNFKSVHTAPAEHLYMYGVKYLKQK